MNQDTINNFTHLVGKDGVNLNVKMETTDLLLLIGAMIGCAVLGGIIAGLISRKTA